MAVILLVITIGVLWYVGKKNRTERDEKQAKIAAELIEKNKNLRTIVEGNLEEKGKLQSFNPTSLFEEETKIYTLNTVTADDLKNYAESMVETFKPIAGSRKNEVRIMLDALDNSDRTLIKEIVLARLGFDRMADDLTKIPAPVEISNIHRDLIISLKNLSTLAGQMEKVIDEPVLALQSGQNYLIETSELIGLTNSLNDYLQKTGVVGLENKINVIFEKE